MHSGQTLYEMWAEYLAMQGVGTDTWDQLEGTDRQAWEALSSELCGEFERR